LEWLQYCRYTVRDLALLVPTYSELNELDYVGVQLRYCFFHALSRIQDGRQIRSGQYVSDAGQGFGNLREEFFVIQNALKKASLDNKITTLKSIS
jgi:phage-related protein